MFSSRPDTTPVGTVAALHQTAHIVATIWRRMRASAVQPVHGAEQVLTIECVGTGRVANQPNDAVPSGDKKTGQRDPEGANGTGDKYSHDVLRPASRTIA
jgi:hypothetical protein